jgi:hypothetical protein
MIASGLRGRFPYPAREVRYCSHPPSAESVLAAGVVQGFVWTECG